MTITSAPSSRQSSLPTAVTPARSSRTHAWEDAKELFKLRLNALVLVALVAGFLLAWNEPTWPSVWLMFHTFVGTALCAFAGSILNQWIERHSDSLMTRTARRPLPQQRMQPATALRLGAILGVIGVAQIALLAQRPLAATVAFLTIVTYAVIYTPMKRISSTSTLMGAIPGALPPLIGWAAAAQRLTPQAWSIFLIMFVWQVPHFFAIAWRYRDEYAAAGIPVLPATESDGVRTAARTFSWSILLIPVSALPFLLGLVGPVYLGIALVLGVIQMAFALHLLRRHTLESARALFLFSIVYLPVLFTALVVDHLFLPTWIGS